MSDMFLKLFQQVPQKIRFWLWFFCICNRNVFSMHIQISNWCLHQYRGSDSWVVPGASLREAHTHVSWVRWSLAKRLVRTRLVLVRFAGDMHHVILVFWSDSRHEVSPPPRTHGIKDIGRSRSWASKWHQGQSGWCRCRWRHERKGYGQRQVSLSSQVWLRILQVCLGTMA